MKKRKSKAITNTDNAMMTRYATRTEDTSSSSITPTGKIWAAIVGDATGYVTGTLTIDSNSIWQGNNLVSVANQYGDWNIPDSNDGVEREPAKPEPNTFNCQYCGTKYIRPTEGKIQCPGCAAPPSDEDIYMAGFNDGFDYGKIDISEGKFQSSSRAPSYTYASTDSLSWSSTGTMSST